MTTKKPVAVVDYSVDGLSGGLISSWLKVPSIAVRVVEGERFPSISPDDFSAVIHSGSSHSIVEDASFMEGAIIFVQRSVEAGVPQMGICYGHQLLARAALGLDAVAKCSNIEVGWLEVDFLPQWPIDGLSGRKAVWQSHYDCVIKLPEGSVITATNSHTKIQAFMNRNMKLFGTQFHPEFDRKKGNECFAKDVELFEKNNIDLETVLASGPGFPTGEVVFDHFLMTFR
ncbi:MAG: gamma-glutamyl-gamma-aminobutyrate hydrolase family protein [Candidatus Sabulitectum sp.]|nr:gamma-glutamyl-gamma-aminobutyrate hydrolase family protein [Candidatus Sabulitectum sp.]